jgi:hypothetical protein
MHLMARRRRKTLVICRPCHEDIHAGRATAPTRKDDHWRAGCRETGMPCSGRGRRKRNLRQGHLAGGPLHSWASRRRISSARSSRVKFQSNGLVISL